MSWITIVGFFSLLAIKLAWDWYQKNKEKRIINHGKSAFYDVCIYIPLVYFPNDYADFMNVLSGILTLIIARGVFFDPLFNILNGDKFFHLGNSALLDIIGDKMDGKKDNIGVLYWIIKVLLLSGAVYTLLSNV